MTSPIPRIAAQIDGVRSAGEIVERAALPLPQTLQAFAQLADWGLIEADWVEHDRPVRWVESASCATTQGLLGLFDGCLEAMIEASEGFPSPVSIYAAFATPSDSAAQGPTGGATGDTKAREIYSGRGLTKRQAVVSCLGEAAERISGRWRGDEAFVRERFTALGPVALHPHALLNFSERQYAGREAWNATHPGRHEVPPPFAEDTEIAWVEARGLSSGSARLLPAAAVYFDLPETLGAVCTANSNGCASGTSFEDAVARGFLELVERDAVAIWWYGRVPRPGVGLASLAEPGLAEIAAYQTEQGRHFHILDLTHDLSVPVFAAVSLDRGGGRIVFGFGAAWAPETAALSAATEMQQLYLSALLNEQTGRDVPDEELPPETLAFRRWLARAKAAEEPYLMPADAAPSRRVRFSHDLPQDADSALQRIAEICARKTLEPLVVDLTRTDIGVPTARVIVPGLRHFWARFGPGRLYDVPVALGWRTEPCAEEALNPTPMFV